MSFLGHLTSRIKSLRVANLPITACSQVGGSNLRYSSHCLGPSFDKRPVPRQMKGTDLVLCSGVQATSSRFSRLTLFRFTHFHLFEGECQRSLQLLPTIPMAKAKMTQTPLIGHSSSRVRVVNLPADVPDCWASPSIGSTDPFGAK